MARFFALDAIFFLIPFAIYALWLLVTRRTVRNADDWTVKTITYLALAGAAVLILAIVFFVHYDREPPGGRYVPAHIENGKIVPGHIDPPPAAPAPATP
jgi:hypothetical protein